MNSRSKRLLCLFALLAVGLGQTSLRGVLAAPGPEKTSATQGSTAKAAAPKKSVRRTSRPRRYRQSSFRRRLAQLRMEPQRVEEIQRALIKAGYLDEEPTGKWDDATRDAMLRYQSEHGFPATGLPEAKTLMKLGLGPHPLPQELDPSVQAQTAAGNARQLDKRGDESSQDSGSEAPPE